MQRNTAHERRNLGQRREVVQQVVNVAGVEVVHGELQRNVN